MCTKLNLSWLFHCLWTNTDIYDLEFNSWHEENHWEMNSVFEAYKRI